jgi:hypothetical protein
MINLQGASAYLPKLRLEPALSFNKFWSSSPRPWHQSAAAFLVRAGFDSNTSFLIFPHLLAAYKQKSMRQARACKSPCSSDSRSGLTKNRQNDSSAGEK